MPINGTKSGPYANSDYGVYQHKNFHVDKNQVSLVYAQKQAPGMFIVCALYTAAEFCLFLGHLNFVLKMGN